MFNKKKQPAPVEVSTPTHEDRVFAARQRMQGAMSVFDGVITELHDAADEQQGVLGEINDEIDRLVGLAEEADHSAYNARLRAQKLADIFA